MKFTVHIAEVVSARNEREARRIAAARIERMPCSEIEGETWVTESPYWTEVSQTVRNRDSRHRLRESG